ncbi:hypothetical protein [Caenispirillum bisanense]|uniref:Uncharacterized protein n=1 Tax=Caenispirillum bisanense TaxID=414052 RepID=A0A286GA20_9PROT|nr:hypothetical protein [Caenispirillum bisanense]SOD92350.1 hypothetical protein SAMN05421508_102390 [Caenispirillum bisanense]
MNRGTMLKSFKPPHSGFINSDRYAANEEPSIDELMGDPIMDALLARDGLHRDLVHRCIDEARARLA